MPIILTRSELDTMQCQHPDCTHESHDTIFFFHSRCHIKADCEVSYDNSTGLLKIDCGECKKNIVFIEVAEKHVEFRKT